MSKRNMGKYGMLVSNFAEQSVIGKAMPGWNIGYKGRNAVTVRSHPAFWMGVNCNVFSCCCKGAEHIWRGKISPSFPARTFTPAERGQRSVRLAETGFFKAKHSDNLQPFV